MTADANFRYNEVLESSHHGRPPVVYQIRTGGRGRPRTYIDPVFLAWAYSQRTTSRIARFLGVGRKQVREQLVEHGIALPGLPPQNFHYDMLEIEDADTEQLNASDLLDPHADQLLTLPELSRPVPSYLSSITDDQLDAMVLELRSHFR